MAAEPVEIPQEIASLMPANLVPTNLPGVYAVGPPAGTFDPRQASPAELRAQGIFLPRPGADDPPAAHARWELTFPHPRADDDAVAEKSFSNLPVNAGDLVHVSVAYVAGNGQILFQNLTTGKVSSIVISPPTGAAASGNCAEWIMETPGLNDGKSLASLPRFSPVYFTGAAAVPASGTTAPPPTSKDVINITRDGHAQTVSAYGDQTVTVTYVGIGWYPIHPEAPFDHACQHVTAVSRAAGNLDLFAIGSDNRVYSIFWNQAASWKSDGWYATCSRSPATTSCGHSTGCPSPAGPDRGPAAWWWP